MKLEQIPSTLHHWVVFGVPIVSVFDLLNPILQAIAFIVAIAWGGMQMYGWIEKRRKRRE